MEQGYVKKQTFLSSLEVTGSKGKLLKKTEREKLQLNTCVKVGTFDLSDEDAEQEYATLLSEGANNKISIKFLSRQWDKVGLRMIAYVEWGAYSAVAKQVTG